MGSRFYNHRVSSVRRPDRFLTLRLTSLSSISQYSWSWKKLLIYKNKSKQHVFYIIKKTRKCYRYHMGCRFLRDLMWRWSRKETSGEIEEALLYFTLSCQMREQITSYKVIILYPRKPGSETRRMEIFLSYICVLYICILHCY